MEHESEVISLTVASNQQLIASSEYAEHPAIHIWDSHSLENLGVIKGIHTKGVHLLKFFNHDEFIASCGIRINTPILIYNIKTGLLVVSVSINEFAIQLLTIENFVGTFQQDF